MKLDTLLDSNVLIAIVAEAHEHHAASLDLLLGNARVAHAVAAHSYAEAFCTLTRRGEQAPFRFRPEDAWTALASVRAVTTLVGLTAVQTFDTVRDYALAGGIGARLYDRLIGECAAAHDIPTLITWNVSHMRSLFPRPTVCTPRQFTSGRTG